MTTEATNVRPKQRRSTTARSLPSPMPDGMARRLEAADKAVGEPFKGITTDGTPISGLFRLEDIDASTAPVREAAERLLAGLTPEQRKVIAFDLESDAWRRWSNIHVFLMRHGLLLESLPEAQRNMALGVMQASLSERGFQTARDIMRLNETIREITGSDVEYGEWPYWLSLFGQPSADEPWGWQIDGHHLIINALLLGTQMVMTPMFMGSEPVEAPMGKYAGTRVFQAEEANGLALMRSLTADQQRKALLGTDMPDEVFTTAFRDNFELRYEGVRYDELGSSEQSLLWKVVETYIGRMRPDHARVKLDEIKRYLSQTHFAWIGGFQEDSVFYYRIHSPVILIEFDHQRGVALDNDAPTRTHIHTVVRTPNGNDYGKDLLRQHREAHRHPR